MIEELSGLLPEYTAAYGVIVEEADYREFRQFETISLIASISSWLSSLFFTATRKKDSPLNPSFPERFLIRIPCIGKSYGIPGLRLGVMATGDQELQKIVRQNMAIWNINSFAE